ncbi:peroxiredoxin family protein [Parapedobacter sp.]
MTTRINHIIKLSYLVLIALTISCNNSGTTTHSTDKSATESASNEAQTAAPTSPQEPRQPAPAAGPVPVIPDFTFYILKSGIRFTKDDLAKTGNIVFILFDPTCSHCQHEANDIGKHYDQVKDAHFYFVSMNDPALMASFLDTWAKPLLDKKNVAVLYDRGADFINKFHLPSQYPATYVYGPNGELKEFWNGERDINDIITAINK